MATEDFNRFWEELQLLRKTSIEDIRFSKQQMWNSVYLTILSIAAVIGLSLSFNGYFANNLVVSLIFIRILKSAVAFIAFAGIIFIWLQNEHQQGYREKLTLLNCILAKSNVGKNNMLKTDNMLLNVSTLKDLQSLSYQALFDLYYKLEKENINEKPNMYNGFRQIIRKNLFYRNTIFLIIFILSIGIAARIGIIVLILHGFVLLF